MFGKAAKKQKKGEKNEKVVDMRVCPWYYIQALEKRGLARGSGGRGNLENDTEKQRETTVNSEMSFA